MTEAEWLACEHLAPMLIYLRGEVEPADRDPDPRPRSITGHGDLVAGAATRTTARRLARFARECSRRWWELPLDPVSRELIAVYERFLDGTLAAEAFGRCCSEVWTRASVHPPPMVSGFRAARWDATPHGVSDMTQHLAWVTATHAHRDEIAELERTATEDELFAWGFFGYDFPAFNATAGTIFRPLPGLLRETVGNPFRRVVFSPAWRTDTAVSLARQMYASRDFSAMPIFGGRTSGRGVR